MVDRGQQGSNVYVRKVIRMGYMNELFERARKEASVIAKLRHDHIVQVYCDLSIPARIRHYHRSGCGYRPSRVP